MVELVPVVDAVLAVLLDEVEAVLALLDELVLLAVPELELERLANSVCSAELLLPPDDCE